MLQGGRAVAGLFSVKGQPGIIVTAEIAQPPQYPSMEFGSPGWQDRLLDRLPRDLVPEAQPWVADHQARGDDLGQRGPGDDAAEQPLVDGSADQGRGLERLPCHRLEAGSACQHHIAGRARYLAQASLQHRADVERIAAGDAVQLCRVDLAAGRQRPHGVGTQRSERKAPGAALDDQIAQRDAQWMGAGQFVAAIGHDQQHRDLADPSREKAQHVEGGLVGPVHVLDNNDRQRPRLAKLGEEGAEELFAGGVCPAQGVQVAANLLRDVEKRAERPGCEHSVAGP